jgi:drug/metabolite transporter (DMT)-like permease
MFSKTDIEKYFTGEKQESWIFMAIGIAGILVAIIFFFFLKTNLHKGMAIPLFVTGLMLGIVGYTVYKRSDRQRIDNVYAYDMNPARLKNEELPRMKKVMKSFVIYRWVEIFFLLTGAGLYIYFIRDFRHDFWRGFGFTLAIMALLALGADYFAEKRGHVYTKGLESYTSKNS